MRMRSFFVLLTGLLLVSSCTRTLTKADCKKVAQTLRVKPFEKIEVSNDYEVIYRQDTFYHVRIEGPDYFVKRTDVSSNGETLSIHRKSDSHSGIYRLRLINIDTTVKVYVTSPDLIGVNAANSSFFKANGLIDTDNLMLIQSNSSDIKLGNVICDNFVLNQYNSSETEVNQLTTLKLKILSENSSDTEIRSLDAHDVNLQSSNSADINIISKQCLRMHAEAYNSSSIDVKGPVQHYTQNAMNSAQVTVHN